MKNRKKRKEREIQDKGKGRVEEEEVILIKLYETSESTLTKSLSFIDEKIDNLLKHMKFCQIPYPDKNILTTSPLSIALI